jgi:hypothetical protein
MNCCNKNFLSVFCCFCIIGIVDHLQCHSEELRTINKVDYAFVNKNGTVNNEKILTIDVANRRSAHEQNILKKFSKYYTEIVTLLDASKLKEGREKIFVMDKSIHNEPDAAFAGSVIYYLWLIDIKYKYKFLGDDYEFMRPAWEKIEKTVIEYKNWMQGYDALLHTLLIINPLKKDKISDDLEFAKARDRDTEMVLRIWHQALENSVLSIPEPFDPFGKDAWILSLNLDNIESIPLDNIKTEQERDWVITLRKNMQTLRKTQHDMLKQDIEFGAISNVVSSAKSTIRNYRTEVNKYFIRCYSKSPQDNKKLIQLLEKYQYPEEDKIDILINLNIKYNGYEYWESEDKKNKTVARLIKLDGDFVMLEKTNGKKTKIVLSAFNTEIQNYIKEQSQKHSKNDF